MGASERTHRLFHHDWKIATNAVRATFAAWQDRLVAAILLLMAVAGLRNGFADLPWLTALWAGVAVSLGVGMAAGRLVLARLAFHAFDGLLAADALHLPLRRRYIAAWHGIGIVMLSGITLIVRPSLLIVSVPAYLVGALMAGLTDAVAMPLRILNATRPNWSVRAWLRHPRAGAAAAIILLLVLLQARTLGLNAALAYAGVGTVVLTLALTHVDQSAVRFMTIAGYGSGRIVLRLSRALVSFVAVAAPGCWLILGAAPAGIVAAASALMFGLMAMRVLAYRLHGKRFADVLVLVLAGLLLLVGYAIPVALPVVALAVFWHLQRRAAAKTWLLV
ncbi:MAG: hypothetical protein V4460_11135 [Pseudomonadota bacterium]|jgi:hypothetical protein